MYCSIKGCNSRSVKGGNIRFFTVPKDATIAARWMRYFKPTNIMKLEHRRVCSQHFAPSAYLCRNYLNIGARKGSRMLKYDAIPTLKLDADNTDIPVMSDQSIKTLIENNLQTLRFQQKRKPNDLKGDKVTISVNEYKILTSYMEKYINIKNNLSYICTPEKIKMLLKPIES